MEFHGDRLRTLRQELKGRTKGRQGSQSWTAHQIGAHVTSISDWERGDNEPSGRYVASLSAVFGVDASFFYGDDEDEEAAPVGSTTVDVLEQLYLQLGALIGKRVGVK